MEPVSQHKRMAMGENVDQDRKTKKYKDGGAVKSSCNTAKKEKKRG